MIWHVGAAAVPARVRPLGPGTARITLSRALPLRIGDRALIRDPGNRRIWGATVLDVRPPELRRRGAAALRAAELDTMDGAPDAGAELRRRGLVRRDDLTAMGAPPSPSHRPVAGEWLADEEHWAGLRTRLTELVSARAVQAPEDPGLPVETVRQALGLPDRALVDALAEQTDLRRVRGRLTAVAPTLPPAVAEALRSLAAAWELQPFAAPPAARLAELRLDPRALAMAEAAGALARVAPEVVLPPDAVERATEVLASLPQPFTAAQVRQALNTSRRVVIPLLEHLDALGTTRRGGDSARVVVRRG